MEDRALERSRWSRSIRDGLVQPRPRALDLLDWQRGDFTSTQWAHPEIEYVFVDGPSPGTWTGVGGLMEGTRGVLSAWEEVRFEVDGYRELDDEHVLVLTRIRARGKTSGLHIGDMGGNGANLFQIRAGKVVRLVAYFDHERALADLGLAPEPGDAA